MCFSELSHLFLISRGVPITAGDPPTDKNFTGRMSCRSDRAASQENVGETAVYDISSLMNSVMFCGI